MPLLLRSRELGDQQGVTDGDLVFQKCLGHWRYEVSESNSTVLCFDLLYVVSVALRRRKQPSRGEFSQHNCRKLITIAGANRAIRSDHGYVFV
jgi:hypothetical protein